MIKWIKEYFRIFRCYLKGECPECGGEFIEVDLPNKTYYCYCPKCKWSNIC